MNTILIYDKKTGGFLANYRSQSVPRIGEQVQICEAQYFVREVIWLIPTATSPEEIRIVVEANGR